MTETLRTMLNPGVTAMAKSAYTYTTPGSDRAMWVNELDELRHMCKHMQSATNVIIVGYEDDGLREFVS